MLDRILKYSVKNKLIILFLTGIMAILGFYSLKNLSLDAVPDITNNQIQVITWAPDLSSSEVERFITVPSELKLRNLPGLIETRSISRFGLSIITLVFEDSKGIYLPRQLVSEKINELGSDLPENASPPMIAPISTGLGEIYQYYLEINPSYNAKYSLEELRTIQDWVIKKQLSGIEGVVEINSFGGKVKQLEISLNPNKLNEYELSIEDILPVLSQNNFNIGGAYIEKGPNNIFIKSEGLIQNPEDFKQLLVKNINGIPLKLGEVAEINFSSSPRFGALTANGNSEVVGGIIMMLKGSNPGNVIPEVEKRVEQINKNLPEGIQIKSYLNREDFISRTINTVKNNLIEGGLIVIFVLVLLLGNFRAGLIVASVIPLAMLFAVTMMNLFGISANLMSLGAIDFGIIVDGSVIIIEQIIHHLHKHFKGQYLSAEQKDSAILESSLKIRKSASFGEIIILIVYLPILSLSGIEGKMFRPMAETVGFAILGAFILSLTYVPVMATLFLSNKVSDKESLVEKFINKLRKQYEHLLEKAFKKSNLIIVTAFITLAGCLMIFQNLGSEFIPTLDEGDLAIQQNLPPGSSLNESIESSLEVQKVLLKEFPEVKEVITKIGTSEVPTDPMPIEAGDIMVIMKPHEEWVSAKNREEMFVKMKEKLSHIPGLSYDFTQPIQMRFNELMTGVKQDIAIKIFGDDLNKLEQLANESKLIIEKIEGCGDIKIEPIEAVNHLVIKPNYSQMARYGISLSQINNVIKSNSIGIVASHFYEGERKFEVVIRNQIKFREDLNQISELRIKNANGSLIPISELAEIKIIAEPMQISRDEAQRRVVIGVNARGRDIQSLVENINEELDKNLNLESGYFIQFGGQFENLQKARARLSIAVPLGLLLIFILLYLSFHSVKKALLIYTAIPLSAIGGILFLWMRDMPFSISAGIGFIALFGVAVLNGLVMVGHYSDLIKNNPNIDLKKLIIEASSDRLRPVLMTALVASLGFLPMALSSSPGAEVQKPLATVVIGGLISSTILTLFILPLLFYKTNAMKFKLIGKNKIAGLIIAFLLFNTNPLRAQNLNQTDSIIKSGLEKFPLIKASENTIKASEKTEKTLFDGLKLNSNLTYGQINYTTQDYNLEIGQYFDFPIYYKRLKEKLQLQTSNEKNKHLMNQLEYSKSIRQIINWILFYKEQVRFYEEQLSQINPFIDKLEKRVQIGQNTKEEIFFIQQNQLESKIILEKSYNEIEFLYNKLFQLSGYKGEIIKSDIPKINNLINQELNKDNLKILFSQNYLEQSKKEIQLARNKVMPGISIGYFNQSIELVRGYSGIMAGIQIPIFFHSDINKIKSLKLKSEALRLELESTRIEQENNLNEIIKNLKNLELEFEQLKEFQKFISADILEIGIKKFESGEINIFEFLQYLNKNLEIKIKVIQAEHLLRMQFSEYLFIQSKIYENENN